MTTAKEIEAQFRAELHALLRKYDTEITLEDHGRDWQSYDHIEVYIPQTWDADGNVITEGVNIDFGRAIYP